MLLYNTEYIYNHSWSNVTFGILNKYPNPFASHVLTADVIERRVDENGLIHTKRLFTKKGTKN